MLLEGLFVPVITPFYLDGALNLRKLEHNVDRYSRTPSAGLAILSDHGEPSLLSDEEARQVLRAAIEIAAEDKVMLAGVSRDSVAGTLAEIEFAAGLRYDAALVATPQILRTMQGVAAKAEVLTYFRSVADRSSLPLILTNVSLPDVVTELAAHPNIIGVVDSSGTAASITHIKAATAEIRHEVTVTTIFAAVTRRMLQLRDNAQGSTYISADSLTGVGTALAVAPPKSAIKTRTKTVGFQVIAGTTAGMLDSLGAGASACMTALSACAPQAVYEVYAAWKDGDAALAQEKQSRVLQATQKIEQAMGIAGIRYACDLNGYFGGRPRLPLLPVTGEQRSAIDKLMQGIRN